MTDPVVTALGASLAQELGATIAVGRDCRTTSPRIRDALIEGITGAGSHVVDIGVVPSPVLYYAAVSAVTNKHLDGAVIITGSHNPSPDNGFKMLRGEHTLHGNDIVRLRDRVASHLKKGDLEQAKRGSVEHLDLNEAYLEHALSTLILGEYRPKVVVDGGNGTGGPLACELYKRIGCEVISLYCEMDGTFPNHHPDPTVAANLTDLCATVREHCADIGIALDGDGDRIGAVDGQGRILWGDQLMLLFGKDILTEVPNATFIGEVKCSQAMYDGLEAAGGHPIMWKVGHSLIKAKMIESGAALAGEMSGHLFFSHRYLGFDDGIYSGARLIELISRSDKSLTELYDALPVMVNTPEIRVECADAIKFAVVAEATRRLTADSRVTRVIDIDGARAIFPSGWGLVRASNTQPSLVIRCEAQDSQHLQQIKEIIFSIIEAAEKDILVQAQ